MQRRRSIIKYFSIIKYLVLCVFDQYIFIKKNNN